LTKKGESSTTHTPLSMALNSPEYLLLTLRAVPRYLLGGLTSVLRPKVPPQPPFPEACLPGGPSLPVLRGMSSPSASSAVPRQPCRGALGVLPCRARRVRQRVVVGAPGGALARCWRRKAF